MILKRISSNKKNGFFIDMGAYHPVKYNNTYWLYKYNNWSRINIEPRPSSKKLFNNKIPRDTNLKVGIGVTEKKDEFCNYYNFKEGALNTFDDN